MAYDYDKIKSQYESLNEQQKQQFANMKWWNVQDFLTRYNAEKAQATTPTTPTTPTNTPTTVMPEYQWAWSNKANTYQNQWAGNYSYDTWTQYYEKQWTNDSYSKIRDKWDSLSYAEQQEKLKQNPNLRAGVEKVGWTFKEEETTPWATTPTWTKAEETPKQWDYQDNSPERMAEIASNLEWYKQTMPYLFNDKNAFDNFFINWKGRSQDQIDFLNDWFYKNQKYGKYDALTPDSIWYWIAYGDIPEDYLTMLKTSDPAKYQAVLQAKQDAEDKIKDRTALDTTNVLSWDNEATITAKAIEWLKSQWLFLDKDGNLIDDRTENYATDEEKWYAKNAADIIARNLDIDNTVKHTYEDLVKAHPWATKATLMAMAQDINADLLREKENNNVELTRLQWYMGYMQTERQERTRIWENAINQLQEQYWMYYEYTPEWMSELAQAQYSATNVTLDQADNWTDTQKQMALDDVLSPIYQQYWSIIERPQAQVINDVIAYAKKNGVSLSQALEENFMSQLKKKPQYSYLLNKAAYWDSWLKWERIWTDENWNPIYWFIDTINWNVSPFWDYVKDGWQFDFDTSTKKWKSDAMNSILDYNEWNLWWSVSDIYSVFGWQDYWECWYFVNDYYKAVTWNNTNLITWTWEDRKDLAKQSYVPMEWGIVFFDWTNSPTATDKQKKYWHVWIVEEVDSTWIWVVDANWKSDWKVRRQHIDYDSELYKNYVAWFYNIPEVNQKRLVWWMSTAATYSTSPAAARLYDEYNSLWGKWLDTAAKQARVNEIMKELNLKSETDLINQADAYWKSKDAETAAAQVKLIDQMIADIWSLPDMTARQAFWTDQSFWNLKDKATWDLWTIWKAAWYNMSDQERAAYTRWASNHDQLLANLMYDKYQDVKSSWWSFGSMAIAEWDALKQAATNLNYWLDNGTYLKRLKELREKFQAVADKWWSPTMWWQTTNYNINLSWWWTYWWWNVVNWLMTSFNFTSY